MYFNQFINVDLSEQDVASCTNRPCRNGGASVPFCLDYVKNYGVIDEFSFPYLNADGNCNNKPTSPIEKIMISGYTNPQLSVPDPKWVSKIKGYVLKSPIGVDISRLGHAMLLVGYKTIQAGDSIFLWYFGNHDAAWVVIKNDDYRIGKTAWIFKDNFGSNSRDKGFEYIITDNQTDLNTFPSIITSITSLNYSETDIVCADRDGDGYYFWGIGNKPSTCPVCSPNEPDGDDSNPNIGPMDEYGFCEAITPLVNIISSSQIWGSGGNICSNISIQPGVTLTIAATETVPSKYTIAIQNGGKLEISGGSLINGKIITQNGSDLNINNNGIIKLGLNDDLSIELGATYEMIYGEIKIGN